MSGTEEKNPRAEEIDSLSTNQILHLMNDEDASVIYAVRPAIHFIEKAVDMAVDVIKGGGRIFYVGAGTSGRLGVLDASEMPPTFGVTPDMLQAIIAGGEKALRNSVEGAEDDERAGRAAASVVTGKDMVLGISASGRTPFVLSFLDEAKGKGAACWLLTCNDVKIPVTIHDSRFTIHDFLPDGIIKIITGPEIIAGSTRLKAGTATKLALNMFSTAAMIRLGNVYKGLMVDVVPSNKKLIYRAEGIIMETTGCGREEASRYLELSGMRPKVAIVMKARGVSREDAEKLLLKSDGRLRLLFGQSGKCF